MAVELSPQQLERLLALEQKFAMLASDLSERLERLGVYRPEQRPWLPHVTVARFRRPPRLRPDRPPSGGSVRPKPLSTLLCCVGQERSTRSKNPFR